MAHICVPVLKVSNKQSRKTERLTKSKHEEHNITFLSFCHYQVVFFGQYRVVLYCITLFLLQIIAFCFLLLLKWCFIMLLHCLCYQVLPSASLYCPLFHNPITFLLICDQLVSILLIPGRFLRCLSMWSLSWIRTCLSVGWSFINGCFRRVSVFGRCI